MRSRPSTVPASPARSLIGVSAAKALALAAAGIPDVGVNHLEGHLHAAWLEEPEPPSPFVALLVSGGHTKLVAVAALGDYRVLGETLDDAAGEAFDKVARLLGLDIRAARRSTGWPERANPVPSCFPVR